MRLPNRRAFWLALCAIACVAAPALLWDLGRWPWDIDEVASLQELHLQDADRPGVMGPGTQSSRLPRLIPVWYWCQSLVLNALPVTERNARLLSILCAILVPVAAFAMAARRHGPGFASCLAALIILNPLFLALAQQNRFYSMAVLALVLTEWSILSKSSNFFLTLVLTLALSVVAVLCHNLLLVVFLLGAATSGVGYRLGWITREVLLRAAVAGAVGVALYLAHIQPIAHGWNESQAPRSAAQVVASFVAETGVPTLALALIGATARSLRRRDLEFRWWTLLAVLCVTFVAVGPTLIWFNYRYALLFLLPLWVLAARGVQVVGRRLQGGLLAWSWYASVLLLLLPKFLSHYQDGSRRDFRQAAEIVTRMARDDEAIYSNWLELGYYLPGAEIKSWEPKTHFPERICYVVQGGNAWDPPLKVSGRVVEIAATIGRRRFDEQMNIVRIYRIWPSEARLRGGD